MDWSLKSSIATYWLRTGQHRIPWTGHEMSPEIRMGCAALRETKIAPSLLEDIVEAHAAVAEQYMRVGEPKKALCALQRAFTEAEIREAQIRNKYSGDASTGSILVEDATQHLPRMPEVFLVKARVRLQRCTVLSRIGRHEDALYEVKLALSEIDALWKHAVVIAELKLPEVDVLKLFSNPMHVENLLFAYPRQWLEQAVVTTMQVKQGMAMELEYALPPQGEDATAASTLPLQTSAPAAIAVPDESRSGIDQILALHEDSLALGKAALPKGHKSLSVADAAIAKARRRHGIVVCTEDAQLAQDSDTGLGGTLESMPEGEEPLEDELPEAEDGDAKGNTDAPSPASPSTEKRQRRVMSKNPVRRLKAPEPEQKDPFKEFLGNAWTVDTMRKYLLQRDDKCVKMCHQELQRQADVFKKFEITNKHPDDLYECRTFFSKAGLRTFRKLEKQKALKMGRPFDDSDAWREKGGLHKSVKALSKTLTGTRAYKEFYDYEQKKLAHSSSAPALQDRSPSKQRAKPACSLAAPKKYDRVVKEYADAEKLRIETEKHGDWG